MQITDPAVASASTGPSAASKSLASDFSTFLSLLTTQLQNQDPLDPLDSSEFTNQLVMFSQLEQQIGQSEKLDDLIAVGNANQSLAALNYIGREVEAAKPATVLRDGEARIAYELPRGVSDAKIQIFDEAGNIVRTLGVDESEGRHELVWNGKSSIGLEVPDAVYDLRLQATDDKGVTIEDGANVLLIGTVTGVTVDGDAPVLEVEGLSIPFDQIVAVRTPA